jgi:hypothetical protein
LSNTVGHQGDTGQKGQQGDQGATGLQGEQGLVVSSDIWRALDFRTDIFYTLNI